jgi:hypothetical protein
MMFTMWAFKITYINQQWHKGKKWKGRKLNRKEYFVDILQNPNLLKEFDLYGLCPHSSIDDHM